MVSHSRAVVRAPGKINLMLGIAGIAPNGYHLLDTVMHAFEPGDVVVISQRPEREGISVTCSRPGVPEDESNIAHKAALAFFAATGTRCGLNIHIDKTIPPEAGLGGGSADAAAVLRGLDAMLGTSLSDEALCEIGVKVGADVPFCLIGGCALARGIGDKLTALPPLRGCYIAIVKPPGGMSTAYAYSLYDEYDGKLPPIDSRAMIEFITRGDVPGVGGCMRNVFEYVAAGEHTERIKSAMIAEGAIGAALSGSGSAVAGLFLDEAKARECLSRLSSFETLMAQPAHTGARVIHLE